MRYLLFVFTLLLLGKKSFEQDTPRVAPTLPPPDFSEYRTAIRDSVEIKKNMNLMKKVLNRQFSNLITGQSKNSIGNFAALDLTQSEVSFAGNLIDSGGSVLTVKAKGGVSDGMMAVFKNSKLNTGISLDVQYNIVSLGKKKIVLDVDSSDMYERSIDKIENDYLLKRAAILSRYDSLLLLDRKSKLSRLIDSLNTAIAAAGQNANKLLRLQYDLDKTTVQYDSVVRALNDYPYFRTLHRNLRNKTIGQLDKLTLEPAVEGFAFGWMSFAYKVASNSFNLFSPKLPFSAQVDDTSFVSHEARIQYSYYKWVPESFRSFFFDAGLAFGYSDNFNSLSKTELSETTEYGAPAGSRSSVKKYNVYRGEYLRDLKSVTTYSDLYYFLFNNNVGALHLNPEWIVKTKEKPVVNFYVGFLLAFKDSKTDNSIVNAELYYSFRDLFKTTEEDYRLFERNNIGIRFSFPIKFKYK